MNLKLAGLAPPLPDETYLGREGDLAAIRLMLTGREAEVRPRSFGSRRRLLLTLWRKAA